MDTTITTEIFAPGKLFVLGEWAVLNGAPAVLIPAPGGQHGRASRGNPGEFRYTSPGFERGGAIDVVGSTEAACRRHIGIPGQGLELHVESRGLQRDGVKLGFGSSGSVAAVVARAWAWACGCTDEDLIMKAALEGHWHAQGGKGSGADVALSVRLSGNTSGRSVIYRREGVLVRCEPHTPPVCVTAVWTGRSADTRCLMDAVGGCAQSPEILSRLCAVSEDGASSWAAGDADGVLEACVQAAAVLGELDRVSGAGLVTDEHERIASLAGEGVVSKLSGAGGGDMALLLARDRAALEPAEARLIDAGYLIFPRLPQ